MVRIIKKQNEALFCLCGIPYRYSNKCLERLQEGDPYYSILLSYESLKDRITEDEQTIKITPEFESLEPLTYDKANEEFVESDGIPPSKEEEEAISYMLEAEETEGDENSVEVDGDKISVDDTSEDGEPDGEQMVEPKVENVEQSEANKSEIDLINTKLEDINENIKKLEDANIMEDDELQDLYLQEVGKKKILEDRLVELGYDLTNAEATVIDKLLESFSYVDLKKRSNMLKLIETKKMGHKIASTVKTRSRKRLLETIKKTGFLRIKESGVDINYHDKDKNFVFSGNIGDYSTEEILVVPEADFFRVFDAIVKEIDDVSDEGGEKPNDTNLNVPISFLGDFNKVIESIDPQVEPSAEMEDGCHYEAKKDLYIDEAGTVSDTIGNGSALYCRKGYVMQYDDASDTMVDEYGNQYVINPKYLSKVSEPILEDDLEKNKSYDMVDDFGNRQKVSYNGMKLNENDGLVYHEFRTKLKETYHIGSDQITIRLRSI